MFQSRYVIETKVVNDVSAEQAHAQLEVICHSQTFHNRDSFRRLLAYLVDKTFDGTAENLKEYTLGIELFGKPENYDPREDASVRVQISKLRQKLEEYYLAEGKDDAVVVELPRRHVGLKFHRRAPAVPPERVSEPAAAPPPRRRFVIMVVVAAVLIFGAGIWAGRLWNSPSAVAAGPQLAAQRIFWGPLLDNHKPIMVCLGTPLFIRFQGAKIRAGGVEDFNDALSNPKLKQIQTIIGSPTMQPTYMFTGVGEAAGAFQLAGMFGRWNHGLELRRNPSLTWEEIRENNVIVLGSAKYNPQLRDLPSGQSFVVEKQGVANLRPRPGEPAKYRRRYSDDEERSIVEDYAVVARLPGVNGQGEIVTLGGSATEGTAAAVDYATDPAHLDRLFTAIKNPDGSVPRHFEAVIRVEFRSMVPVSMTYVDHRVITRP